MIAIAYLAALLWLGHLLTGRWFRHSPWPYRLAVAFAVGLPVSTWITYLGSLPFAALDRPLVLGNLLFLLGTASLTILVLDRRKRGPVVTPGEVEPDEGGGKALLPGPRTAGAPFGRWDWAALATFTVIATWMMTSTFGFDGANLRVGIHEIGDFGPNIAIAQGFSIGHNFPTEYPLFAGASILYHFLFYFQAGNLSFLGLELALAANLLSIASLVAMLVLVMALGDQLFASRAVGRIAAGLFFFHGSLSFVPWLASFGSPQAAVDGVLRLDTFLTSPFPYRGEDWAIWTQNVFLNQRHLASAVAILLVTVLFVLSRRPSAEVAQGRMGVLRAVLRDRDLAGYALFGALLGMLPLWNGAVFLASAAVMGGILALFPNRLQVLVLGAVAAVLSAPQLLYLRSGAAGVVAHPSIHWGFTIDDPTPLAVAAYLGFLFGPKLLLMAVAALASTARQRRFLLAISSLVVMTFVVQWSVDIFNNHKLLTLWLILGNLFAASGLVVLWRRSPVPRGLRAPAAARRLVAVSLAGIILVGGAIDLVPIHNDPPQVLAMDGDRLYDWVEAETDPRAVFLSDVYIHHPILRAGRRIYLGWPAYPWSLGYDLAARERSYRGFLTSDSPRDLLRGLQEAGIDYVAIDDGLREGTFVGAPVNESIYRDHFPVVFDDTANAYRHLTIYRVPTDPALWRTLPGGRPVDLFTGGRGEGPGRFDHPRGIGVAPDGTVLVADSRNHRVQRFAADGQWLAEWGGPGDGPGAFEEPHGVAADSRGHVFVADWGNDRVQEFDPDGRLVGEWRGPDPPFYGPRDVVIGPDDTLYVLDQGRARVVGRTPTGMVTIYGSFGAGDGELNDPTGVAVGRGLVVVADPANRRIVVFSVDGRYVRSIAVPEWDGPFEQPDVAVDLAGGRILASSPATNEVLAFSFDGRPLGTVPRADGEAHDGPGGLAVRADGTVLVVEVRAARVAILAAAP